jgi:hypothetical protein
VADVPGASAGSPRASSAGPDTPTWRTHVALGVALALCALAFWVELSRARGGNSLSWAYVFEWPLLGAFAIYMWWRVRHPEVRRRARDARPAVAPEFEGMLAAWQEHVRDLEASRTPVDDTPGTPSGDD